MTATALRHTTSSSSRRSTDAPSPRAHLASPRPVGPRPCARRAAVRPEPRPAPAVVVERHVRPATPAVYRRRRLAALAGVTLLATVVVLLAGRVGHADAELDGPPPAPEVYVVQPGDTLWSIADEVAPDVDRRDVVAQLSDAAGGSELVPGQRIELPRFFD